MTILPSDRRIATSPLRESGIRTCQRGAGRGPYCYACWPEQHLVCSGSVANPCQQGSFRGSSKAGIMAHQGKETIEDLNVSGMLHNHHLAQAIAVGGFHEFRRRLLYKAEWHGSKVMLASRSEPSSKTCPGCEWVDENLMLTDRTFHCQQCGLVLDRDRNVALNVPGLAQSSSDTRNASGAGRSGTTRKPRVKRALMKHEQNAKQGLSLFG